MASMTELFLDDQLIEMSPGITRRIHQPRKHRLNPVMRPEHWWESTCIMPNATLYDREEKLFKMWYRTGSSRPGQMIYGHAAYTAYATSTDGVHWERPMLGALEFNGRTDHNIVMVGRAGKGSAGRKKKGFILSVIQHPHPKDESEKYVCLSFDMAKRGAYLGRSSDGIHWSCEDEPFWQTPIDVASWGDDNVKSMIYDKFKGKWVMYRRVIPEESERMVGQPGDENWTQVDRYVRVMGYADSCDLKRWENYRTIMVPDADDPPDTEFYGLTCHNYEQIYVGYLWVYHTAANAQNIDIQLLTSRDGIDFTRVCRREVFLPSGPQGYFDYEICIGYQAQPIVINDRVYLFYEGCNYAHTPQDSAREHSLTSVGLATFPRDRFVALQTSADQKCRLATRPLVVDYPKLFLNASTWTDGQIRVEALTRDWTPIEGFSQQQCHIVKGDALAHPVHWEKNAGLSSLIGKEIRLKFYMADARIHAIVMDEQDREAGIVSPSERYEPAVDNRPVEI